MEKRILFVGEHPYGVTGCSRMLRGILEQLDYTDKAVTCFVNDSVAVNMVEFELSDHPYKIISASDISTNDMWGVGKLLAMISSVPYDLVFFVGVDIWRYAQIYENLNSIRQQKPVRFASLFPYDVLSPRGDWIEWVEFFDYKFVYSEYGFNKLKPYINDIQYYRPPVFGTYNILSSSDQMKIKQDLTQTKDDTFLFGFVGVNQVRKDPQVLIKAFSMILNKWPQARLYLHTELKGVYNLVQYASDCGIPSGKLLSKQPNNAINTNQMHLIYNAFDCFLNCSLQEGLSWTPIEAMLCGVPCILSDSTSHKELKCGGVDLVPSIFPSYMPLITKGGQSFVDAMKCSAEDVAKAMSGIVNLYYNNPDQYAVRSKKAQEFSTDWQEKATSANGVIDGIIKETSNLTASISSRLDEVLFVQHSSAGDVLITTQCFKGIKERHPGKKLVYMTQKKFQGIVEGNPYIDEIVDFYVPDIKKYLVVYNPHGEKILPGGWNNLDVTLHSMYPYFCKVEASPPMIEKIKPKDFPYSPNEYVVVNTGGASEYRKYKHSAMALNNIGLPVVQIGDSTDPACVGALDLRDRLSWKESAWVMAHAKVALAVDSFCAHLAGAVDTPAVVLFGPAPARVTKPWYSDERNLICMEPNMLEVCPITSHCYSNTMGRNKCTSPCINTISPMKVRENLLNLMKEATICVCV